MRARDPLLSRRSLLGLLGISAASVGLAACGGRSTSSSATPSTSSSMLPSTSSSTPSSSGPTSAATGEIPDETAGAFRGDGSNGPDVLEQSGSSAATSGPA